MEIFGIDVWQAVTNPMGALAAAGTGALAYQGYRFLRSVFQPIKHVRKLYEVADHIVEQADNTIIDKIRNKQIKKDVQTDLKNELLRRQMKIKDLIDRISD